MKRRKFLYTAGGAALASRLNFDRLDLINQAYGNTSADIIVVGAGIFGVWTAFYLRQLGANVTLIDAYGPGNSRSSSGGESRILRSDYGDRMIYTHLNIKAYELWKKWQEEWGEQIILSTGRLILGIEDRLDEVNQTRKRLKTLGVDSELLDQDELSNRWPQINVKDITHGVYYPGGAGGSALMARRSCQTVAAKFIDNGGILKILKVTPGKRTSGKLTSLVGNDQSAHQAAQFVFACGPWMPKIFPELLADKLKVYRRDVFFVGTKAGDDRFSHPNFPIWSFVNNEDKRYYGMPDLEARGLKVAPWPDHNSIDMDTDERVSNPAELKRVHEFVEKRFPSLRGQPILESRVCQLTFSNDEHFIIDRHPELDNVWLACGGSGHAFKHGPALGEYLAGRIYSGNKRKELDQAFRRVK